MTATVFAADPEPHRHNSDCCGGEQDFDIAISTEEELRTFLTVSGGSAYLTNDIKIEDNNELTASTFNTNISLCLNGHSVDLNGQHICVKLSERKLDIYDCKNGEGEIKNGYAVSGGAIAIVGSETSVNLYYVTIHDCSAAVGGAVYAQLNGSFTMHDGIISSCSAVSGGAVHLDGYGTRCYLSGGSVQYNIASCGGAVYNGGSSIFIIDGATLSGNYAYCYGGGVYSENYAYYKFTGENSIIKENTASHGEEGRQYRDNFYYEWNESGTHCDCSDLGSGSEIWITQGEDGSKYFSKAAESSIEYLYSDIDAYMIDYHSSYKRAYVRSRLITQPSVNNGYTAEISTYHLTQSNPYPTYQWKNVDEIALSANLLLPEYCKLSASEPGISYVSCFDSSTQMYLIQLALDSSVNTEYMSFVCNTKNVKLYSVESGLTRIRTIGNKKYVMPADSEMGINFLCVYGDKEFTIESVKYLTLGTDIPGETSAQISTLDAVHFYACEVTFEDNSKLVSDYITYQSDDIHDDETVFNTRISDEEELKALFARGGSGYLIDDIALTEAVSISENTSLCLNGYNINLNGDNSIYDTRMITINEGVTLNLYDHTGSGKIYGGYNNNYDGHGGAFDIKGTLNMYDVNVSACSGGYGGVFYVEGTANINGGNISDGTARHGGVFYVPSSGALTISGASITSCSATDCYGGALYTEGTVTLRGTEITSCVALRRESASQYGKGGAIYNYSDGTINIFDGVICNCYAGKNGGAVYADDYGTVNIYGGVIDNCCAADLGGAIYINSESNVNISNGAIIKNCIASDEGGAAYVSGALNLQDSIIENCFAQIGGAVSMQGNQSSFNLYNGEIVSCAAVNGGGVNTNGNSFHMYGGSITSCKAISEGMSNQGMGGAVYNVTVSQSHSFHMHGGSITGNTATYVGGGVLNSADASFDGKCIIKDNYANLTMAAVDSTAAKYRSNFCTMQVSSGYHSSSDTVDVRIGNERGTDRLAAGSEIWVSSFYRPSDYTGSELFAVSDTIESELEYFHSDIDGYHVTAFDSEYFEGLEFWLEDRIVTQPSMENDYTVGVNTDDLSGTPIYEWYKVVTTETTLADDTYIETVYGAEKSGNSIVATAGYIGFNIPVTYKAISFKCTETDFSSSFEQHSCGTLAKVALDTYVYVPAGDEFYIAMNDGSLSFTITDVKLLSEESASLVSSQTTAQLTEGNPGDIYSATVKFPDNCIWFEEIYCAIGGYTLTFVSNGATALKSGTLKKFVPRNTTLGSVNVPVLEYTYEDIDRNIRKNGLEGWYTDTEFEEVWNADTDTVNSDMTLYANWISDVGSLEGNGRTSEGSISGASVALYRGSRFIASSTTTSDGSFIFEACPAGKYQMVVSYGSGDDEMVSSVLGEIPLNANGKVVNVGNVILISGLKSKVEVVPNEEVRFNPEVLVGGLDRLASDCAVDGKQVEVKLTVNPQAATASSITQTSIRAIAIAKGQDIDFLEIGITNTVSGAGTTYITDTGVHVIEVVIPLGKTNKENISVYRYHEDGNLTSFTQVASEGAVTGECFYLELDTKGETYIHLFAQKFSLYAVGFTIPSAATSSYIDEYVKPEGYKTCPQDETCVYAKFTDSDPKAWYHPGVHFCVEHKYMNGIAETLFDPNGTLSRAMIVTILWNIEGQPMTDYAMSFKDVSEDQWYTEAIRWAQSTKVVEGYDDDSYGPQDNVTREQLAAILHRYAKYKGYDYTSSADLAGFTDANNISDWALANVQWANSVGIISGRTTTTIVPRGTATRAEAANMIQRFCETVAK